MVFDLPPPGRPGEPLKDDTIELLAAEVAELYNKQYTEELRHLVQRFSDNMQSHGLVAANSLQAQLLELLKEGLPKDFANTLHQPLLTHLNPKTLLVRQFVVLLRGVGKSERNMELGRIFFEDILNSKGPDGGSLANSLRSCLLCSYTIAQLQRKTQCLPDARTTLQNAVNRLEYAAEHGDNPCCPACDLGPNCLENGLPLEIYRGMAVVYRSQKKRDEAEEWFQKAERQLAKTPNRRARSDFLFSYGYCQLEWAYLEADADKYRQLLENARQAFLRSEREYNCWAAPLARRAMTEHLLWALDTQLAPPPAKICETYRDAEFKAKGEKGEAPLTRYLCALGAWLVALQADQLDQVGSAEHKPRRLRDGLADILAERNFAPGPRKCHAFDARFVLEKTPQVTEPALKPLIELLTEIGAWNNLKYADFIRAELDQLEAAVVSSRRPSISPATARGWALNGVELTKLVEDEQFPAAQVIGQALQQHLDYLGQAAADAVFTRKLPAAGPSRSTP